MRYQHESSARPEQPASQSLDREQREMSLSPLEIKQAAKRR
jgi:hypothetical protein